MPAKCINAVLQNSIQIENEAIHSADRKQFFKYKNSKTRTHSEIPPLRNENGDLETQDGAKAKILNYFFSRSSPMTITINRHLRAV